MVNFNLFEKRFINVMEEIFKMPLGTEETSQIAPEVLPFYSVSIEDNKHHYECFIEIFEHVRPLIQQLLKERLQKESEDAYFLELTNLIFSKLHEQLGSKAIFHLPTIANELPKGKPLYIKNLFSGKRNLMIRLLIFVTEKNQYGSGS